MLWSSWPPERLEKEKQQQQQSGVLTEKVKFENGNDKF